MLDITFTAPALRTEGTLVLPLFEDAIEPAIRAATDEAHTTAILRALEAAEFRARKGKTALIPAPGPTLARVLAVGLGKRDAADAAALEDAGGTAASALARQPEATVAAADLTPDQAARFALGAALRAWRFDRYRTTEKPDEKPLLTKLALQAAPGAEAAWATLKPVADGVILARDLVSEPPNVLTPKIFADRCRALAALGLTVEVLEGDALEAAGFRAFLAVGQGSVNPPAVVIMHWHGAPKPKKGVKPAAPLGFIGKGVTFDSGGISIKPAAGMEDMKWDMAGAGAVVGAMAALAGRRAPIDVVGLVGLVENMPSGSAQRPGDVVKTLSGQTVEVANTDAEGRLVLADVIAYARDKFAPRLLVDLATLTGAIIVALGHEHAGLFANDDALADALLAAGKATGEKLWRMPLHEEYDRLIKSDIADMKNIGGRPAGAITGAQFIGRFVGDTPWAHLDIAGMAWSSKDTATIPKGATAFGVRLLDRFAAAHEAG